MDIRFTPEIQEIMNNKNVTPMNPSKIFVTNKKMKLPAIPVIKPFVKSLTNNTS